MSTVLAMRFNQHQALLVADESTWHLGPTFGYRRTNYGDALATLFEPEESRKTGLSAVYAGTGFPSFHHEVARRTRSVLAQESGPGRWDNRGVAHAIYQSFLATHERMIDDKLKFNFGFGRDGVNSRSYVRDGKKYDLGMDSIADAARSIAGGSARGNAYTRIFTNSGFAVTHDSVRGIQGWHIDSQGCHLGFATPISVLGEGDEVSTHLIARFIQRRDLEQRRKGFPLRDGLYIALSVATEMRFSIGKMGGYFQLVFVDGDKGARELVSDAAHLVAEVMRAHLWGFIPRKDAEEFVCALVLDGADDAAIEKQLFQRASEPELLRRYLIGFKPVLAPAALPIDPPPAERRGDGAGRSTAESEARRAKVVPAAAVETPAEARNQVRQRTAGRKPAREGGDRK
jgi:hypothetical protein